MVWAERCPELNPKGHDCDIVGRRLRQLPKPPNTLGQLLVRLVEIWNQVDQEEVKPLIPSMKTRCQTVIHVIFAICLNLFIHFQFRYFFIVSVSFIVIHFLQKIKCFL